MEPNLSLSLSLSVKHAQFDWTVQSESLIRVLWAARQVGRCLFGPFQILHSNSSEIRPSIFSATRQDRTREIPDGVARTAIWIFRNRSLNYLGAVRGKKIVWNRLWKWVSPNSFWPAPSKKLSIFFLVRDLNGRQPLPLVDRKRNSFVPWADRNDAKV